MATSVAVNATALPRPLAPLRSCTLSPTPAPVPARPIRTVGVESSVPPPLATVPVTGPTLSVTRVIAGAFGAVVSMVTASPGEARLALPAMSVCRAGRVWGPLPSVVLVIDQLPDPSAVVEPTAVASPS